MMWLTTKPRRTATLGREKMTCSPFFSVHVWWKTSSAALARAAWASATFLSNSSRTSSVVAGLGWSNGTAKSSPLVLRVTPVQVGRVARWVASLPMVKDLGCACQPNLSVGIRCSVRRVLAISRSNSGSNIALMLMLSPHLRRNASLWIVEKTPPDGNVRVLRFGGGIEERRLIAGRSGVEQPAARKDAGVGVEIVRVGPVWAQDVQHRYTAGHQRVGDEAAVAAPGHRFGAEDGHGL